MNELPPGDLILMLGLPLVVGVGLGIFFFGGLWWTVQRIPTAEFPGALALGSMMIRTLITVAGFYWVMDGSWERLLAAGAGFVFARLVMVRRVGIMRNS
jgi:F1F0 ATPase subunit 2